MEWGSHEKGVTCKLNEGQLFGGGGKEWNKVDKNADKFVSGV